METNITTIPTSPKKTTTETNVGLFSVTSVIDGDTIKVNIGGKVETLRLIGIDTPETVDPRKLVQCFGKEASEKAKELLSGKRVKLEADPTQGEYDKYNRLLRYVFLEDETNFNKMMILEGYAHEYTYVLPYKYQMEFKQAEKDAREAKRGLWADDTCAGDTTVAVPTTHSQTTPSSSPPAANTTTCDCESNTYNCTDFKTHQKAQALFDCCKIKKGTDVHNLDSDSDGVACESLP